MFLNLRATSTQDNIPVKDLLISKLEPFPLVALALTFRSMLYSPGAREKIPPLAIILVRWHIPCQAPCCGYSCLGAYLMKKYKLKTHKGTAKRIKFTGSGLALREHAARTKYRRKKRGEIVRSLKRQTRVADGDVGNIRRLLPYG